MLYEHSYMETYTADHVTLDQSCKVQIEAGILTIEYLADGEHTSYRGQEQGPGQFELHGNGFDGRATLHMFEGSNILEGGWVEEGQRVCGEFGLAENQSSKTAASRSRLISSQA